MSATGPTGPSAAVPGAVEVPVGDPADGEVVGEDGADVLDRVRGELAELEARPVAAHVGVFERVNAVIAAELSALDEV